MPSAGYGATPPMVAAARTRSGKQRGGGERVGSAAGPAERQRGVGADMVKDRRDVFGHVPDGAARAPRRRAVPGRLNAT